MYCDYETPKVYEEKRVKARKPQKCCETGKIIQPGEYYWRCEMLFDGSWSRFRQSEEAYHFARKLNGIEPGNPWAKEFDDGECVPFGDIDEHMREMMDHPMTAEWREIMAKAKGGE